MKRFLALLAIGATACEQSVPQRNEAPPAPVAPEVASAPSAAANKSMLIPLPADKAQVVRLEAMGYTVHDNHLHLPGVDKCPMDMGASPIQ